MKLFASICLAALMVFQKQKQMPQRQISVRFMSKQYTHSYINQFRLDHLEVHLCIRTMATYLDMHFFRKALEEGFRELGIVISAIEVVDAGIGGDNYCSTIYRAKVDFNRGTSESQESISLIVKSMPNVNFGFLERLQVYIKEKVFYMDIMQRMEVLPRKPLVLGAKHFYSTTEPVQTIVLQDLSSLGFELQSRQLGLDEEHATIALKKLGQFHALSMVLMQKDPSIEHTFCKGLLHEEAINSTPFVTLFGSQLLKLAKLSGDWEGFEKISLKLFRYHENFSANVSKAVFPLEGTMKVLNHGDLWVNNLLFQHDGDEGGPRDMRMIDFQFSFCGSPGFDLNYFLYTSLQLDVLALKRDQLVRTYHQSLVDTLEELHHESIPSLEDIENEILNRERYGFFVSFAFFPMISMHKEDSSDNSLEGMQDSEIAGKKIELMFTTNTRTLDTLRYVLQRFDELGVLD